MQAYSCVTAGEWVAHCSWEGLAVIQDSYSVCAGTALSAGVTVGRDILLKTIG